MRTSRQRVMLAGAGFFLLISSSLSLVQQSLQRNSANHHANRQQHLVHATDSVRLPDNFRKVRETIPYWDFDAGVVLFSRIKGSSC